MLLSLTRPAAPPPTLMLETPSPGVTSTATPGSKLATAFDQIPSGNSGADSPPVLSQASDSIDSGLVRFEPEIGEITFALAATEDYEPVTPGLFYSHGITEVHAIFNYSGMSSAYIWERVWYLNDREIARVSETWAGPEAGVFDYSIDNSGRPLPAGDWVLELYVEDKLHALGVFIIERANEAEVGGP